jgi:hypothetical protein
MMMVIGHVRCALRVFNLVLVKRPALLSHWGAGSQDGK